MRLPVLLVAAVCVLPVGSGQDSNAAKDPRNLTWIVDGVLAPGGGGLTEDDVEWLASEGFGGIVDLRSEYDGFPNAAGGALNFICGEPPKTRGAIEPMSPRLGVGQALVLVTTAMANARPSGTEGEVVS